MKEIIMPVTVAGLTFKNPFYVASGPTVRTLPQIRRIEETGWAAASIKLSIDPAPYINRKPRYGVFDEYRALAFTAEKRLTFQEGLKLVSDAKKFLAGLLLFANITYAGEDETGEAGWINMAKKFEEAGADVIELNMCCPNMSYNVEVTSGGGGAEKRTGASLGQDAAVTAKIVGAIKKSIRIPLFVKLTPEGGRIAQVAHALYAAGADAVGGTGNRLAIPPIDPDEPAGAIYHLQKEISMSCYSGPWLKPLALRDVYEIRKVNGPEPVITATGGISNWKDALDMILCGADLLGICTETLMNGYDIVRPMIRGLKNYMDAHGYASPGDFRGMLVPEIKTAPELTLFGGKARILNPRLYAPCKAACPWHIPVQAIMQKVRLGELNRARELLRSSGPFGNICFEFCDAPCERVCVRDRVDWPVRVRDILRHVRDYDKKKGSARPCAQAPRNGKSIGLIGSGPSGLSAAFELSRSGYAVTVYEREEKPGGSMRHCAFDGAASGVDDLIAAREEAGIVFKTGTEPGKNISLADMRKRHDALIFAAGRGEADRSFLENAGASGVYDIAEFMRDMPLKLPGAVRPGGKSRAIVIGSGDLFVEAARRALALGCEVFLFTEKAPAGKAPGTSGNSLFDKAKGEGIKFFYNIRLKGFSAENGKLLGVVFANKGLEESPFTAACDIAVLRFKDKPAPEETPDGVFEIKPENSFVRACAAGIKTARSVDRHISGITEEACPSADYVTVNSKTVLARQGCIEAHRSWEAAADEGPASEAATVSFETEVSLETMRCLNCGCGEGCGLCGRICCEFAPAVKEADTITINQESCVACGMCYNRCPNKNIIMESDGRTV
jgi:dihydroorotate dehydrogenase/NADPH-dependent glutamate synthase beta subunit-like oxidoreductase/Pyruvate/2-oxoacid:ferredoxin oxidoreductase delta subunit